MSGPDHVPAAGTDSPLAKRFRTLLVDLDGVVYRGPEPVTHAQPSLAAFAAEKGRRVLFVTNNASRTPAEVCAHLSDLGFADAGADQVVTSVQAAVAVLESWAGTGDLEPGSRVLVVGAAALGEAVLAAGWQVVGSADDEPAVVVQGFSRDLGWKILAEATYAIDAGARWLATNTDATLPTERGRAPGNGAMIAAVGHATGTSPEVAGKPERALFDTALRLTGADADDALVVGDRLDSDILGANRAGLPSLLVMTGVTTPRDLLLAAADQRPTYIGADLRALAAPAAACRRDQGDDARWVCGDAVVTLDAGRLVVSVPDDADDAVGSARDALTAAAAAMWSRDDAAGAPDIAAATPVLEQLVRTALAQQ